MADCAFQRAVPAVVVRHLDFSNQLGVSAVWSLLEAPLQAVNLLAALETFGTAMSRAAGQLDVGRADNLANQDSHCSAAFLRARLLVGQLRSRHEEAAHRLWLCEQAAGLRRGHSVAAA